MLKIGESENRHFIQGDILVISNNVSTENPSYFYEKVVEGRLSVRNLSDIKEIDIRPKIYGKDFLHFICISCRVNEASHADEN